MLSVLYNLLEVLIVLVPTLLSVAFMTIIERKVMGSMQRRIGPNVVGYYGVLQPFRERHPLPSWPSHQGGMITELYAGTYPWTKPRGGGG